MSKQYYVYKLKNENGDPFYWGKGSGDRVRNHFENTRFARDIRNKAKTAKINNMVSKGYTPTQIYEIVDTFDDEQEAYIAEAMLIHKYGVENLTNIQKKDKSVPGTYLSTDRKHFQGYTDKYICNLVKSVGQEYKYTPENDTTYDYDYDNFVHTEPVKKSKSFIDWAFVWAISILAIIGLGVLST